jgi:hypothetical protein
MMGYVIGYVMACVMALCYGIVYWIYNQDLGIYDVTVVFLRPRGRNPYYSEKRLPKARPGPLYGPICQGVPINSMEDGIGNGIVYGIFNGLV